MPDNNTLWNTENLNRTEWTTVRTVKRAGRVATVKEIPRNLTCYQNDGDLESIGDIPASYCRKLYMAPTINSGTKRRCMACLLKTMRPAESLGNVPQFMIARYYLYFVNTSDRARCKKACTTVQVPDNEGTGIVEEWYWLCGHVVYTSLPRSWTGTCAIVQLYGATVAVRLPEQLHDNKPEHRLTKVKREIGMRVTSLQDRDKQSNLARDNYVPREHRLWNGAEKFFQSLIPSLGVSFLQNEVEVTRSFIVMFPNVIESGFEAKLCASLLKPNESLLMSIYLVDGDQSTLLLQEKAEKEFHRCFNFQDSQANRIGQWTNISSTKWILQLSHELNPEAHQGVYKLKAFIGERMITHDFEVKKYVLPKFEVTLKAPKTQSIGDVEMKIEVCGKYTYGQPVPGNAWVEVCCHGFEHYYFPDAICPCLNKTAQMNETGCASYIFNTSAFLYPEFKNFLQYSLEVKANVTEEGTDTVLTKSEIISLTYEIGKVTFANLPDLFEHGTVIEGTIKVAHFNGTPIHSKAVYLLEGQSWSPRLLQNLTTDSNGLATFSLDTASLPNSDIHLMASVTSVVHYGYNTPYFTTDEKIVRLLRPDNPTLSELNIENIEQPLKCDAEFTVTIKYYFIGETVEDFKTDIVYMVLSKRVIVHHGYEKVEVKSFNGAANGTVSFKLSVGVNLAPAVQILAYCVLPNENVVAHSTEFKTEKCFENKVSLQFSPAKAVPGEKNTLQISAQPGSLCGLSAVDQSVLILESGKHLDTDKIFNLLPVQSVLDYPYDEQEYLHVGCYQGVWKDNIYKSLKCVGLKMATNLAIREPQYLSDRHINYVNSLDGIYYDVPAFGMRSARLEVDGPDLVEVNSPSDVTIRTVFPETWIWQLAEVGDSGSAQVPVTVPDTITSWETEAFCLSSKGLGLAPPAQLTVFQPFFLELSLPYSIIRGEIFELKATVFNYLSKCIMVKVTPAPSSDYTLKASSDDQYSSCLCANGRKTFKWILTPSVLGVLNITVSAEAEASQTLCDNEIVSVPERGRIDTVTQSLLVQAEGTEKTKTYSWLLCPKGDSLSEEVDLTLPKDVIEGSARSSVSVIGDILGRALRNLHRLLQMPYGCGEQNMAILSPNIYILQYLENTEQLTSAIRERATDFLKNGYQRQLNYRHNSGAYSTFGHGDENTWLTAFVLRSFGKAQKYIFIDPQIIQSAEEWLIIRRDSDGCFIQQGTLFNNKMKGGVNDNVTMTAYITASLLELEIPVTDPVVTKSLSCLRSVIEDVKNIYTIALLAYAFSLARDTDTRQQLFKKLEDVAISDGSHLHWSQSGSADDSDSLAVEISSYVLLAVLTTDSVTPADLGFANRIVSWLVKQQNAYGGFSSTQDTVVALQALSLYATKVFSSEGSSTVTVQSAGDTHYFDVNQDNKLLYQEKQLQNVPAKYSIEVKGSTCVSVQVYAVYQITMLYNIPPPPQTIKTLSVEARVTGDCLRSAGQNLMMNFTVTYNGTQASTNMVIADIKLLSGFTADTSMLGSSPHTYAPLVERVDSEGDHVIVYLKEVPKNIPMSYRLQLKQGFHVRGLRPAVIRVYDYYQTSDQTETAYSSPCT
ncbi:alpha-2-macroglobulin-like protein [Labeo rohita]|uniref:Alpha-2-macroglobulin-like protein n=1 Tax=Labeo rohita TaxID=84645 RepID=A0A498L6A5_LABRO|nr:alpha-2-macroglobulin-like protein [Labeo rohita]